MKGLQIEQKEICEHKILPKNCIKCQIQTFILCQKYSPVRLIKNLYQYLFEILQKTQKVFVLDFRLAENTEEDDYDDDEEKDENMSQGLLPPSEELPAQLRIVFIGEEEAYYGFICSLLLKYGSLTIFPDELDFGSEKFWPEIDKRCHWGGSLDKCFYEENPQATGYMLLQEDNDDFMRYLLMTNIDQFFSGYCKMLELNIPEVKSREVKSGSIRTRGTYDFVKCDCVFCTSYMTEPTMLDLPFKWSKKLPVQTTCSAYWFYMD